MFAEILPPTQCPSCDSVLEWVNDQLFCRNGSCPAQNSKAVEHFAKTIKIKGRTSGVSKEGVLILQAKAFGASIECSGIPKDFLQAINKNDIIEVSGTFIRKKGILGHLNFLKDCFRFKKLK